MDIRHQCGKVVGLSLITTFSPPSAGAFAKNQNHRLSLLELTALTFAGTNYLEIEFDSFQRGQSRHFFSRQTIGSQITAVWRATNEYPPPPPPAETTTYLYECMWGVSVRLAQSNCN